MSDCHKCHRPLQDCTACNAGRARSVLGDKLTCKNCSSTGLVCNEHGGHWK